MTEVSGRVAVGAVSTLAAVDPAEWDRLVPEDGFYSSHGWLRTLEGSPAARTSYLLASRHGRLAGALPVTEVLREFNSLYRPERYLGLLDAAGTYLVAGSRRGYRNVLVLDPELEPAAEREVVSALVDAGLRLAADRGCDGLAWPFLTSGSLARLGGTARVEAVLDTAEAEIPVDASGLEGYAARLSSSRRRTVRRELDGFARAGWQVAEERLAACRDEAAPLLGNVQRRYGHRSTDRALAEVLARQAELLDDRSVVFSCRDDAGALAAFALMYRWRRTLYGRLVGFDYERLRSAYEYFNLAFYVPIAHMSARGLTRLHLGTMSLETKALRGAELLPLWAALTPLTGRPGVVVRRPERIDEWRRRFGHIGGALPEERWWPPA